ncbi:MAG: hypothetical protein AB8B91_09885 [Rubripirellula sp.]
MSNQALPLRQQLMIDKDVQGAVLQRTVLYSVCCVVYFMVIMFFTSSADNPDAKLYETILLCLDEAVYWAPGLIILTPVIAYDLLTLTNRFAGPVFRLRREMERLAKGEPAYALSFRDGDYWMELADLFNQVRDELLELREFKELAPVRSSEDVPSVEKLFTNDEDEDSDEALEDDLLVGTED